MPRIFEYSLLLLSALTSVLSYDVITTSYGPVRGESLRLLSGKRLTKFLGIPYANASRFEPPHEPTPWNITFNATKYGKACPQPLKAAPYNLKAENISEYCLNLNIFVPNTTAFQTGKASYPVVVMLDGEDYVYGGGFRMDGSVIASNGELLVVTVNHRLGALGFLSMGEDGISGNYALMDVIAALRWVQNNIKR